MANNEKTCDKNWSAFHSDHNVGGHRDDFKVKVSHDLIKIANDSNKKTIENLGSLEFRYDGLVCPKCGERTVYCQSYMWCPKTTCDYGNEFTIKLFTKWT